MARYIMNPEKNGIEIFFPNKPNDATLVALKLAKWRWHPRKGCWYNNDSHDNKKFAEQICAIDSCVQSEPKPQKITSTEKKTPKKQAPKPVAKKTQPQKPKTASPSRSTQVNYEKAKTKLLESPKPVTIPEPPKRSERITFSENVKTLDEVRRLLVLHNANKPVFGEDILDLVMALDSYNHNSEVAAEVIKRLFPAPQMAYDKFMGELADSDAAFLRLMRKGADIIGIAEKRSARRDEILHKIRTDAHSLADLCDDFATVLINKYGDSTEEDENAKEIEMLLMDMQSLIESVKLYS